MKIEVSKVTLYHLIQDADFNMNSELDERMREYYRGLRDAYKSILILEVTK